MRTWYTAVSVDWVDCTSACMCRWISDMYLLYHLWRVFEITVYIYIYTVLVSGSNWIVRSQNARCFRGFQPSSPTGERLLLWGKMYGFTTQKNRELSTYLGLAGATSCVLPSVKRTYITVERSTMLCSWVNPLEMAIFNSYFDITRGYNYSIKWIIIPLNPLFRLGHGFNRKLWMSLPEGTVWGSGGSYWHPKAGRC